MRIELVKSVMAVEVEVEYEMVYRFEKTNSKTTGGVNIYLDGKEVDYFTNYSIGNDQDKFEKACLEHLEEMLSE
jgi:hypothetical protein